MNRREEVIWASPMLTGYQHQAASDWNRDSSLFRLILPLEVPAMNSEFNVVASRPGDPSQTDACATQPAHVHDEATIGSVTYTYEIPEDPGFSPSLTTAQMCVYHHQARRLDGAVPR